MTVVNCNWTLWGFIYLRKTRFITILLECFYVLHLQFRPLLFVERIVFIQEWLLKWIQYLNVLRSVLLVKGNKYAINTWSGSETRSYVKYRNVSFITTYSYVLQKCNLNLGKLMTTYQNGNFWNYSNEMAPCFFNKFLKNPSVVGGQRDFW